MSPQNIITKTISIILALALTCLGAACLSILPDQAEGTTTKKSHMRILKLNWDLQISKKVTVTEQWAGLRIKKKVRAKITGWQLRDYEDDPEYNELSFKVTFTRATSLTKKQVKTIITSKSALKHSDIGGNLLLAVADYYTGKDLLFTCGKTGVMANIDWEAKKWKRTSCKKGTYIEYPRVLVAKVNIRYPKKYKGLCIGIGGSNISYTSKIDKKYQIGRAAFGKTSFYKQGKANSHWMRVR